MEASKNTVSSTFLTLSPSQSSPPASPTATKVAPTPIDGQVASPTELVEPLKKIRRSSSGASESDGFLRLGQAEE